MATGAKLCLGQGFGYLAKRVAAASVRHQVLGSALSVCCGGDKLLAFQHWTVQGLCPAADDSIAVCIFCAFCMSSSDQS